MTPLRCADCDANLWYRWNGRAYEALLHAAGEPLQLAGKPGRPLPLFHRSGAQRQPGHRDPVLCARGRWKWAARTASSLYRVEALVATLERGWVPQQYVVQRIECKE